MNQIYKQTTSAILLTLMLASLSAYAFLTSFSTPSKIDQSDYLINKEGLVGEYEFSKLQQDWFENLELSKAKWDALDIHSYTIQVIDNTMWLSQGYEFKVEQDKITRHVILSCKFPGNQPGCHADTSFFPYNLSGYSIPNLFELANLIASNHVECAALLSFDPDYYFPNRISFDCPGSIDEEYLVFVTSFEPTQ